MHSTDDDANALLDIDFDDVAFGESAVDGNDGRPLIRLLATGFHARPLVIENYQIHHAGEQ